MAASVPVPVADEGDDPPLVLEAPDGRHLVGREDLGDDLVDADLRRHGLRRALVVTGEQHRVEAECPELPYRLGGGGLDRVGHDDDAGDLAVDAGGDGGLPLRLCVSEHFLELVVEVKGPVGEEPFAAGDDGVPVDHALDAEPGSRLEGVHCR
jgi:hypothetical protein